MLDIAQSFQQIVIEQREVMARQQAEIITLKLEYSRWAKQIIENFLIGLDRPEDEEEMRVILAQAVEDMADEVARLEEMCA